MKTNDEIRARVAELRPLVEKERAQFNAACDMEPGPAREAALEDYDEHYPEGGCELELELDALEELLPDLERIEAVASEFAGTNLSVDQKARMRGELVKMRHEYVVGHIRNARHWVEVFGMDSIVRIEVFSEIIDIEPNLEPLDDATEEEEEMFKLQIEDMVAPIKKAMEECARREEN